MYIKKTSNYVSQLISLLINLIINIQNNDDDDDDDNDLIFDVNKKKNLNFDCKCSSKHRCIQQFIMVNDDDDDDYK